MAFISDVYRKSTEIEITEDVPRIASITGESPPYDHRKYLAALFSTRHPSKSSFVTRKNNNVPLEKKYILLFLFRYIAV